MTIGTNDTIDKGGTQDEVTTAPATVTDGNFSIASDTSEWLNDDDAPWIYATLELTAVGLSAAPDAGASVSLFTRLLEIQGVADDDLAPQADFEHGIRGVFPVENTDVDQFITIGPLRIPNPMVQGSSQKHEPYIKNDTGVALGTTWKVYFAPATFGPHA